MNSLVRIIDIYTSDNLLLFVTDKI